MSATQPANRSLLPRLLVVGLAATALLLLHGQAPAQGRGRCASADVPSPIVLPDGSVHPPGVLSVCLTQAYSPVSGLHQTRVNGNAVGMFVSRVATSEAPEDSPRPYFLFLRNGNDELVLHSYAWPRRGGMQVYALQDRPGPEVTSRWQMADAGRAAKADSWVLLAALEP